MSAAAPTMSRCGVDLTPEDYRRLEERWITPEIADAAGLRRVDSFTARDILGRKSGNLAGILIPSILAGTTYAREYRVRLDEPNGNRKYLSPAGRPNLAYFPPMTPAALLGDVTLPVIITEGEFKTLALWRLATHGSDAQRFMRLGFSGVWSFRGTIGKKTSSTGERIDEKGVIADVERVTWQGRKVLIAFDADAPEKEQVRIARAQLARELRSRGATVAFFEWDIATGKGIDDHFAAVGPDVVLGEIAAIDFERREWRANLILNRTGEPRALLANAITALRQSPEWEGVLAFNEFSIGVVALKPTPWGAPAGPWTDHEDRLTADWLHGLALSHIRARYGTTLCANLL